MSSKFPDRLLEGLACAALGTHHPNGVLLFDEVGKDSLEISRFLRAMVAAATGDTVDIVTLSSWHDEDDLWGTFVLKGTSAEKFTRQEGLLTGGQAEGQRRIVVIPELANLSLTAMRAIVSIMGMETAYLERHGQKRNWTPKLYWLAGCDRPGAVSPHLLDRFGLRLQGGNWSAPQRDTHQRGKDILARLEERTADKQRSPDLGAWAEKLKAARDRQPAISEAACDLVRDCVDRLEEFGGECSGHRDTALARLAVAVARLEGKDEVDPSCVEKAASIAGFPKGSLTPQSPHSETPPGSPAPDRLDGEFKETPTGQPQTPGSTPVYGGTPDRPSEAIDAEMPEITRDREAVPAEETSPYREDTADIEREAASLRLPVSSFRTTNAAKGVITGDRPTNNACDLAIAATLREAAKFQPIRRKNHPERSQDRLVLLGIDLRAHRRAPAIERMLLLVLDCTCLNASDRQTVLKPYTDWAYESRASVCLILIGAQNATHWLRAEKIAAGKFATPRIRTALIAEPGKATPLAHGLMLALHELRHALRQGTATTHEVAMVVLTDGRGNVPLAASLRGAIEPFVPVKRQGIEDALQVAAQIRDCVAGGSHRMYVAVLDLQPEPYSDLPYELAMALGGGIVSIPNLNEKEVPQ
ncbi:hypothetical protein [Pseudanabaena sp. PCC 6802]|uniref:hypothetical protein n=1 Tax=Pseudanabaena sp. PCC 6802 TaxID=118173 RepID=UPI000345A411|nr:hypothetical protein [Pseudanabaena sp. PCC 6802]